MYWLIIFNNRKMNIHLRIYCDYIFIFRFDDFLMYLNLRGKINYETNQFDVFDLRVYSVILTRSCISYAVVVANDCEL